MDSPVEYGFGVSLLVSAEDSVYLASPGFADPRLVMRRRNPLLPMAQFDRCVFRFELPSQEQKRSLLPDANRDSLRLTYGRTVCLVHQHSGLYVTIVKKPAESNPEHFKISLMTQEDAGSACKFRILPRYKIRSEGDTVCDGDIIYLQQQNSCSSLCAAPQKGIDEPEVTAWEIPSSLQISLYDGEAQTSSLDDRLPVIRAGTASLIFHREQDMFLTIPTVPLPSEMKTKSGNLESSTSIAVFKDGLGEANKPYFKRSDKLLTSLSDDSFDFSCNSLWIIENTDPTVGGAVTAGQPFRIRHGATGKYLVVRKTASATDICLDEIEGHEAVSLSIWEGEIVSAADATGHIYSLKSFLQIRHRATRMYFSTSTVVNGAASVQMSMFPNLADTLALVNVPRERQQELSYLIGNVEFLKSYIKLFYKMQEPNCHLNPRDPIVSRVVQRATTSLAALICFCTESEDSDPLTREGLPIAHHQQSMFEVQLHSTAMDVLLCPFVSAKRVNKLELPLEGGVLSMEEILDPTYANIYGVCRLCYRLLKQMCKGSPFAGVLVEYVDFMKAQEGYKLHVADTQMEIFTDNPNIPLAVCEDNIRHFVKLLLTKGRSSGYLRFMSSLCVVGDVGVAHNQKLVCDLVLRQHADKVLYKTSIVDGVLSIRVPKGQKGSKKKAVSEDSDDAVAWTPLSEFLANGESKTVKFFETSIDLLGVLALGGIEECLTAVRQIMPIDQLTMCMDPDFPASDSLRASFFALSLHLYIREVLDRFEKPEVVVRYACGSLVHSGATADFYNSPSSRKEKPASDLVGGEQFLERVKGRALEFIQNRCTSADRSSGLTELLLATTNIWHSVVLYDQPCHEEISRIVQAVVKTLEVGLDAKVEDRYKMSEDTSVIMKTKRGLCLFLQAVLDHETTRISDTLMRCLAEEGQEAALLKAEQLIAGLRQAVFADDRLFPILLDLMFYENKDLVSIAVELALGLCNVGGIIAERVSTAEPVRTPLGVKAFKLFVRVTKEISHNLSPSGNVINAQSLIRAIRDLSEFDPTSFKVNESSAVTSRSRSMSTIAKLHSKVSLLLLNRSTGTAREGHAEWRKCEEGAIEYARLLFQCGLHRMLLKSLKLTDCEDLRLALLEFFRVLCASPACAAELCQEINVFVPYVHIQETQSEASSIILRLVQHMPSLASSLSSDIVSVFVELLLKLREPVIAEGLEHVVLGTYPVARHQEQVLGLLLTRDVVQNLLAMNSNWPLSQLSFNSACVDLMACCCVGNSTCKAILTKHVSSTEVLRTVTGVTVDPGHLVPYLKLLASAFLSVEEFLTTQDLQVTKRHWMECSAWWTLVDGMFSTSLQNKTQHEDFVFHGVMPVLQAYYNNLYMPLTAKSKIGVPASNIARLLTSFAQSLLSSNTDLTESMTATIINAMSAVAPHVQHCDIHEELRDALAALQKVQLKVQGESREAKRDRLVGVEAFTQKWAVNDGRGLKPLINLLSFGTQMHLDTNVRARRLHEKLVRHIEQRELSETASIGIMASFRHCALELDTSESEAEFIATQNYLCSIGGLRMVTEIAITSSDECGAETMRFATAILENGNKTVQNTALNFFLDTDERFFHEIGGMIRVCTESTQHHRTRECYATFYSGVQESKLDFGNLRLVLRFLQLLCEGHHLGLQDYLREQRDNLRNVNVPKEIERFAAELSLHDLDAPNLEVMDQTICVLTELCQGPCRGNQKLLVSSGVCHVISRIMSSSRFVTPAPFTAEMDAILTLKHHAMILLNALLEGTADPTLVSAVTQDISLQTLGSVLDGFARTEEFLTDSNETVCEIVYCCIIAVKTLVQSGAYEGEEKARVHAIMADHSDIFSSLGQIEIERNDIIEPVYFRVPTICRILSEESKETLKWSLDRSTQGSKLSDFLDKCDELIFDLEAVHRVTQQMKDEKAFLVLARWPLRKWDDWSLMIAIAMNLLFVAVIEDGKGLLDKHVDWLGVEGVIRLLAYVQLLLTSIIAFLDSRFNFPLILYKQSKTIKSASVFQKAAAIMQRNETLYRFAAVLFAIMGFISYDFFFAFHLLGLISRSSELKNVIVAVTQNGKTLLLTGLLGCVVVYLFSIIAFVAFHDHFEHSCNTLSQCVVHILTTGLRQGGGIGDQMETIKVGEPMYVYRTIYDFLFWAIMIVIFLNILFGIIIDTFAELRDEKSKKEEDMRTRCTICGIDSYTFDRYGSGFREHTREEHNMWTYLYFLHHLKKKEPTEYTGQESHVAECVANGDISFFPAGKCSSLKSLPASTASSGGDDGDDNQGPRSLVASSSNEQAASSLKAAHNLLASSISTSSDQTMSMLQKILAKLDSQPDGGSRVTPQHSFRRGLTEDGGPRSADVIRLEHANHNLQRQVYEMERSHTHELDVARSVHAASVSRIAHELFDSVEKFVTHLRLLMTLDATASRAKSELFFNAVAAYLHAVAHKAHTPSRALPKLGSPRRDGANESAATGVDDGDNLLRDGQEVMKLLRMTIRETRAAMSTKDNGPADKK